MTDIISLDDIQRIKEGATFSNAAYGRSVELPSGNWQPFTFLDYKGGIITTTSGYQARVYVDSDTGRLYFANTGTNQLMDVKAWPSAYFGAYSDQVNDMLTVSKIVDDLTKTPGSGVFGYQVTTTGHSLAEGWAQTQVYTFGWKGIGFDGIGAGAIVGDARFATLLENHDIVPVQGTDFIDCKLSGILGFGSGLVGDFGFNIEGTRECSVQVSSGVGFAALNFLGAAFGGFPGYLLTNLYGGVKMHDMTGIYQSVMDGKFNMAPDTTQGASNSVTVDIGDGTVLNVSAQGNTATFELSNYGSVTGQTGMMSTYDLTTGESLGSAQSYSDPNHGLTTPLSATTDYLSNALHAGTGNTAASNLFYSGTDSANSSFGQVLSIRSLVGIQGANERWGGQTFLDLNAVGAPNIEFNWDGWSASGNGVVSFSDTSRFLSGSSYVSFGNSFNLFDAIGLGMIYSLGSISSTGTIPYNTGVFYSHDKFDDDIQARSAFPIVLDLNGNGVEFIDQSESYAFFDYTDTGYRTHTGWISSNDAFLTIDSNHSGNIDQAKELALSQWTSDPDDTDLGALKTVFDTNHDNTLDAQDASFADFSVWQDKNGDGVSDAGELQTLTEAGITSFDLNAAEVSWNSGGNAVLGLGNYTRADGTTATFADAGLGHDADGWKLQAMTGYQQLTKADGTVYAVASGTAGLTLNLTTANLYGAIGDASADKFTATGTAGVMMQGNAGNDSLVGGGGDDWLEGGAGSDTLSGGAGDDTLLIDATDLGTNLSGGTGFDILVVQGATGVTMNLATQGFESAIGSDGNDNFSTSDSNRVVLAGHGGNDTLLGSNGTDLLEGGTGDDILQGKAGDDYYQFNRGDGADVINETYIASVAHQGNNPYREPYWNGFGYSWIMTNHYYTYYTNEQVNAGNDTLVFGADITLNDLVLEKSATDMLVGLQQPDATTPIANLTDHITLKNWDNVMSRVEAIELADGSRYAIANWKTGTAGNDVLTGDTSANVLSGLGGADTMAGVAGNDAYAVDDIGDIVIEVANQGTDLVESTVTYTLSAHVENLTLVSTANINGTGNELNNTIIGNSADNVLSGGAGDDTLKGAGGNDTMLGGLGNDTYIVSIGTEVILENFDEGIDLVQSSVSSVLSANLENLTLTGLAAINGDGNDLDNVMTGNQANNTLTGGAGNDTLIGGAGDDNLIGGTGNDIYTVDAVGDVVTERLDEGADLVNVAITTVGGSYTLSDNIENATLTNTVAFTLKGNALNNVLTGNAAVNTLIGGAGDDTYVVNVATDVVVENANEGTDTVLSSVTSTLIANVENLTLTGVTAINGTGNASNNIIVGNAANNTLSGLAGNDTLIGGAGVNTLIGGDGDDLYVVTNGTDVITEAATLNAGTDTVESSVTFTLAVNVENLSLTGAVNINGTGNILNNTITGNAANNVINGLAGNDTMIGGLGNDTYTIDVLTDVITENLNEGIDLVNVAIATAGGTYSLASNIESATLTNTVAYKLTGNELDNVLTGNATINTIIGGAGNDTLDGGVGADALIGGIDDDTYFVDNVLDVVTELSNEGTDLVKSTISYSLVDTDGAGANGANLENLTLTGTAAINGTGNVLDNTLTGNGGANVLNGNGGTDTFIGGDGNDTYVVDSTDDTVTESNALAAGGVDLVQSSVDWTLGTNIENLTLTGTGNINGTGNTLANTLTGNGGVNTLDGGAGADNLTGGSGNDTYIVDLLSTASTVTLQDIVTETADATNSDTLKLRTTTDTINGTAVTLTLAANLENFDASATGSSKLNLTGNAASNILTGNAAANILNGGTGTDTLIGGGGNDTYMIDVLTDIITENANEGIDLVNVAVATASGTYTLGANLENATLTNTVAYNLTGNELDNVLTGNAAINTLIGGAGNDTLNGLGGNDIMLGGVGDDNYTIDVLTDNITENADEGIDLVNVAVATANGTYTLGANIEKATLTSTVAYNLTGNELDNVLTGNTAANILNGGLGADMMIGGTGNDTYLVDNIGDIVTETSALATELDLVQSSISYTLGTNLDNLTLTGTSNIDGNGNSLNNTVTGNAGSNTLDGGAGIDALTGGAGNDTYIVDLTATNTLQDTVTEVALGGIDTLILRGGAALTTVSTITLGTEVDNLDVSGTGITLLNLTGNAQSNTITGNAAANTLDGATGADTLIGGAGNDTYLVDHIGDLITETDATTTGGIDLVKVNIATTGGTYSLTSNVENATLTNTVAYNLTGNELDNMLTGNAAANMLTGGDGNDTLNGLGGNDIMIGGIGDDTYTIDALTDTVTESADEGVDIVNVAIATASGTYTLGTNLENATLTNTVAYNLTGNELDNMLTGNAAANILNGGLGADTLTGGAGNDTYVVDDLGDVINETSVLSTEIDLVQSSVSYSLGTNLESLTLTGTNNIDGTGNNLVNTILGNAGNNTLDGGLGADILTGGAGNDTYIVDLTTNTPQDTVTEVALGGIDTLILRGGAVLTTASTITLGTEVDNLDASYTGTTLLNLTGNALSNTITGNAANNIINGLAGNDTMIGGLGNDTYTIDVLTDVITENLNEGIDLVNVAIATAGGTYSLASNIENATLTNTIAYNLTANELDNILTGNAAVNTLSGGAGNDTLNGLAGADTMLGGLGNDLYMVDATGDIVTENLNEGTDTVQSGITYTLGNNLENLMLTGTTAINGTGNAMDNVLTGNAAANILNGGLGADLMIGGTGNDTYAIDNLGDIITETSALATEIDLVQSSVSYTLGNNLENLTLTGANNIDGVGNAANNIIIGNTGNNILDGGAGVDLLTGGVGNDTYIVDLTATNTQQDTVTEVAIGGIDTLVLRGGAVLATASTITLGTELDNLDASGTGTTLLNLTGNTLNNSITGNAAANILDGATGADTLIGGAGNDTYLVDNIGDLVTETDATASTGGIDLVKVGISTVSGTYSLTSNVENATLTNTIAYNLTGNELDNTLTGNAAVNTLSGGAGNDTLNGLAGNDIMIGGIGDDNYTIDVLTDTITENVNEGVDIVNVAIATASGTYTLGTNLENATLINTVAYNLTGNELDNVLTGNAANNTLISNAGNDLLNGGAGADTLNGGLGNDTYLFGRGYGIDTITDSDTTVGNSDVLRINTGVAYDQLWFKNVNNNLEVSVIGTTDKTVISNWFLGNQYHVEQIKTVDGNHTLVDSQVQNLVNAMAGMTPPPAGQTSLTLAQQSTLAPVLAANWQ